MNVHLKHEVTMHRSGLSAPDHRPEQRGQIIVIAALAMVALIGGVSLVLEGGNAYAHQRVAQNAADSIANAGATVLAAKLGGASKTDADVLAATNAMATANAIDAYVAFYTNWKGQLLTPAGAVTTDRSTAAQVGPADGFTTIPAGTQGVSVAGNQTFDTTFGRVIGINQFTAAADAVAVTGATTGGQFLPVVFPVNIVDCDKNGDLGTSEEEWHVSQPDGPDADSYPDGTEYIVPLCKTGGGSFMVLDLDGTKNNCDDEVLNPGSVQFSTFPVDVDSDNGNNCAKKMVDAVNTLHGTVVLVPICDDACSTSGGSKAQYHITKVAPFYVDYMSDSNHKNGACDDHTGPTGQPLVRIAGNGSDACIAGWFVRHAETGTVGPGDVSGAGAISIQLIR